MLSFCDSSLKCTLWSNSGSISATVVLDQLKHTNKITTPAYNKYKL